MAVVGGSSPDPITCCSRQLPLRRKQNPYGQRGGRSPRTSLFPDRHGPSVPSILDIPAEPFSHSLAVTRWQFCVSCSPSGNVPWPEDTAAPRARAWPGRSVCSGGMQYPTPVCTRWVTWGRGTAAFIPQTGSCSQLCSGETWGQGWRGIATWLPLGGLLSPEEGCVMPALMPIIPLGLY